MLAFSFVKGRNRSSLRLVLVPKLSVEILSGIRDRRKIWSAMDSSDAPSNSDAYNFNEFSVVKSLRRHSFFEKSRISLYSFSAAVKWPSPRLIVSRTPVA